MAKSSMAAIRLIVVPESDSPGRFSARLEGAGEPIVTSTRQPLVDGARALLARGFDPTTLLTMRHEGSACDSFKPAPIRQWVQIDFKESDRDGLRRVRWAPPDLHQQAQKSGFRPLDGPGVPETGDSLVRADRSSSESRRPQPTAQLGQAA